MPRVLLLLLLLAQVKEEEEEEEEEVQVARPTSPFAALFGGQKVTTQAPCLCWQALLFLPQWLHDQGHVDVSVEYT